MSVTLLHSIEQGNIEKVSMAFTCKTRPKSGLMTIVYLHLALTVVHVPYSLDSGRNQQDARVLSDAINVLIRRSNSPQNRQLKKNISISKQ